MARKLLTAVAVLVLLAVVGLWLFVRGAIGGDAVRRTIEQQLTARVGQPVRIASVGASFFPRVSLNLNDVTVGEPVVATIGTVAIGAGLRGLFSRRVEEGEIVLSDGRIPIAMVFAIAGAAGSSSTSASEGLTIVSVRTLALRRVELVTEPHSLNVDLESSLAGDRLDITRLVARAAGTELEMQGAITSLAKREGKFTARSDRLNLDELLTVMSGLPQADGPRSSASTPMNLTVELTADSGALGGYSFSALASTIHVTASQVQLRPLRFGIFDGTYDGELRVMPSSTVPGLALSGRADRMDVAGILRDTSGSTAMSGRLSGSVSVAGRGQSTQDILRAAHGNGRITIVDGVIPGLDMVRSIVLAFGRPSGVPPAGSGSAFTRLTGTFALDDQTLRSNDVTFASRDFDMAGTVTVTMPSGAVTMRADVVLSRELTAQAGTDLRRYAQEDGRVVVPAVITGTLAQPSITIDMGAALNRALQNEVKRKLGGLFKRIIK